MSSPNSDDLPDLNERREIDREKNNTFISMGPNGFHWSCEEFRLMQVSIYLAKFYICM